MIRFLLFIFASFLGTTGSVRSADSTVWQGETYGGRPHLVTVSGRRAFVILPLKANPAYANAWVWYAPVIGANPPKSVQWLFSHLLANGIAIAGIDVGETYGNHAARQQFEEFYHFVRAHHGLAPQAILLGQSRGGLNQYLFGAQHPEWVRAIAGIYPVMNVRSYPGISRAAQAYGMSEAEFEKRVAEANPIDNLAPLARAGVPIFHVHGDDDKIVPLALNTAVACDRYRALGGKMEVVVVPGKGHAEIREYFESPELLEFLLQNSAAK